MPCNVGSNPTSNLNSLLSTYMELKGESNTWTLKCRWCGKDAKANECEECLMERSDQDDLKIDELRQ